MNIEQQNTKDPLRNWIKEAGTDNLGSEFHLSILKKIEEQPKISSNYEPVISSFAWKLIGIFIAGIFGSSLFSGPSNESSAHIFEKIPSLKIPSPSLLFYNFNLPNIEFSTQFVLGIGAFFILGFIMIVGTIRNKQAGI